MRWFVLCYWYEPDAPDDPVGLVRIWTLARHLTESGEDVTVFPPRYRSALLQRGLSVAAVPVVDLPVVRPLSYVIRSFAACLLAGLRRKPDVVYYRWMSSPHPVILARLLGARCVCEVNGEPVLEGKGRDSARRVVQEAVARWALRRCDGIVALTAGLRKTLVDRYGVTEDRVQVLPSGTDTAIFHPQDARECRKRLGLDPEVDCIGFVGTFYRYQGLPTLLTAFVLMRLERPSLRLLLVGDGETAGELKQQALDLGIDCAIAWTGRVPYAQVPIFIGAMTVCVAPFRGDRGETSPVKILDYLACGRAVVASGIRSVAEVFGDETGVRLVPSDDPLALACGIMDLLDRPEAASAMGRKGRTFVQRRFDWGVLAGRLGEWIHSGRAAGPYASSGVL